ncbi:MAG: thioredoxin domain-containing protein [Ignavibacteriae bacterium HGW-Ignavibacteriae-2]|nr:MAG: thioredoxin domain-containing protein [Ignavibacteriae bacterium HGW-Ignavibacteriae-2]
MSITSDKTNRLINEKSPYLLQHAYNPVEWFPWCDEAFEKAAAENKPIFLSIGYSTCHWCHVMEKESFEDSIVAELLNKVFIPIKVDREERPDIDSIYMTVCQMTTGRGGWPLTIFMTPDKKPFFAGTYFSKESRQGRIGLIDLIERVNSVWKNKRSEILASADQLTASLTEYVSYETEEVEFSESDFTETFKYFDDRFDTKHGGFGSSPKFPSPHNLLFLLRYWKRTGEEKALKIVIKTLTEMRNGGIFDHIGYGFHRYSTDKKWLLPHFEKMLYDQAMLSFAYIETYQVTGDVFFSETAEHIFEYILRDMTNDEGGFYSAEDADSEGEEGKFYVWSIDEVKSILDNDSADVFIKMYNLEADGNFADEATGGNTGSNILHVKNDLNNAAYEMGVDSLELKKQLLQMRNKLFEVRKKRIHPLKDDKILTDWNGLMIAALAKAGRVLDKPVYTNAAQKATKFICDNLQLPDGKLLHRYRNGSSEIQAHLDDYAFFIWGLIELYESTFESSFLLKAIELQNKQIELFWDESLGGFFFSSKDGEKLIVRNKDVYDGAIPSGNSVSYLNLIRLAKITAENHFNEYSKKLNKAFSSRVKESLPGSTMFLNALDFDFGPSTEIIFVGNKEDDKFNSLINDINKTFIPNCITIFVNEDLTNNPMLETAGYLKSYKTVENKFTVYVCRDYECGLPVTTSEKLFEMLKKNKLFNL